MPLDQRERSQIARVIMNCLEACSIIPWPNWSPILISQSTFGNHEKVIAFIPEHCRLNSIVRDNLAQNSALHHPVTLSVYVVPDDILFSGQRWTNILFPSSLCNRPNGAVVREASCCTRGSGFKSRVRHGCRAVPPWLHQQLRSKTGRREVPDSIPRLNFFFF